MQIADLIKSRCTVVLLGLNKFYKLGDEALCAGVLAYFRHGIRKADGSGCSTLNKYCEWTHTKL